MTEHTHEEKRRLQFTCSDGNTKYTSYTDSEALFHIGDSATCTKIDGGIMCRNHLV
jgi:hypothetical protein